MAKIIIVISIALACLLGCLLANSIYHLVRFVVWNTIGNAALDREFNKYCYEGEVRTLENEIQFYNDEIPEYVKYLKSLLVEMKRIWSKNPESFTFQQWANIKQQLPEKG